MCGVRGIGDEAGGVMIINATIKPADLPATLRHLRKTAGLTLAEVATGTGISVSYLSDLERGRHEYPLTGRVVDVLAFYGYEARVKLVSK